MSNLVKINAAAADFAKFTDVRPASRETYQKAIKQFLTYLDTQGIKQPQREDVINWRENLLKRVRPATAQIYLIAVKRFFKWTQAAGLYPDISQSVKGVQIASGHKRDALTQSQARQLLQSIDRSTEKGLRDFCMLSLMTAAGLRTIEIERANVEDLQTIAGQPVLFVQGKGHAGKDEFIKIEPPIMDALTKYLTKRNSTAAALFISLKTRDRLATKEIRRLAKTYLRGIDLDSPRLSAHSLRHTAATIALLNGVDIRQVQQLLRHSSINTTLIYAHDLDKLNNQATGAIAAALF